MPKPIAFLCKLLLAGALLVSTASAGSVNISIDFYADSLIFSTVDDSDVVTYRGYSYTTEIGSPQLPEGCLFAVIPEELENYIYSGITIDSLVVTACDSTEIVGPYNLLRAREPDSIIGTIPGQNSPGGPIKPSARYDLYPSDLIEFTHFGYLAGYPIAGFLVHPVRYIDDENKIYLYDHIDFTVYYSIGGTPPVPITYRFGFIKWIIEKIIDMLVVNPSDVLPMVLPPSDYEYVIITDVDFVDAFKPLENWKTKKGISCTTVTTQGIYGLYGGADNQERIRNFIIDAYSTWGAGWFLLGGDVDIVPARLCRCRNNDIACDLYYSDLDGDWDLDGDGTYGETTDGVDMLPDVIVGRAPVDNVDEVEVFVRKVLNYERWPQTTNYSLNMLLTAFDANFTTTSHPTKELIDNDYVPPRFDPITKVYDPDAGNHRDNVLAALNAGMHLVNHIDHGNHDVIGTGSLHHGWDIDNTDMDGLSNGDLQTVWYTVACHVAEFDYSPGDCIAEHFVNNPDGGGVAFMGNSGYGWFVPGENPLRSRSLAYDLGFFEVLFLRNLYHLGQTFATSKADQVATARNDTYYRYTQYALNLLGEPSLTVWTDEMDLLDVEHTLQSPILVPSAFDVTVVDRTTQNTVSDAYVCISGCGVYQTGFTDATGLYATTVQPTVLGHICVTVSAQNYVPHVSYGKACSGFEDILIRDCAPDDGRMPSWDANRNDRSDGLPTDRAYWCSPDIVVDAPPYDGPGDESPIPGELNRVYAYVKNISNQMAIDVNVDFWWADYGIGSPVWDVDFHYIGTYIIPSIDPGATETARYFEWQAPENLPTHTCIWARIWTIGDPIIRNNPGWDNNIGWKNYTVSRLSGGKSYQTSVDFDVRNIDSLITHDVEFEYWLEDWPENWSCEITSSDPDFQIISESEYVFSNMSGGEERIATISVTAPDGTENDTGLVHVAGYIDEEPIGGVSVLVVPPGICDCTPGDANGMPPINIMDITYLISYLYKGGTPPTPYETCSGDPNCNCSVNIIDVTYLINFLYKGGPPPCECETWTGSCGSPQ